MITPNKVALVTGAGSGIGRAIAIQLVQDGFSVTLTGRRRAALEETAQLAGAEEDKVLMFPADVSSPRDVAGLFEATHAKFQRLDLLFNNAGIFTPAASIEDVSLEHWQAALNVNLTGAFLCTQEAFKLMKRQEPRGGRIINNGSISAHVPRPRSATYTATKHAMTGLTKVTSLDGRQYGIACGQIDIGNATTDMTEKMQKGILQANGSVMVEPTMDVRNVARAVSYMASLPLDANVQFMTVMATDMPFIGRG
ncbi:SDR family oxidoreductase [Noviherbaspirillum suwonense]|uniref:NAD(P)-dependent dehydrogenase, short-chain alcohol dehydrogenase family n=1 Tax=Noviherbaspirillum suwonense TaxID=1224511 RepID=A0ABY1PXE1_9BURK|nr:SDR family oxidoreductase [Noviherbaspirillum suwonense]SMP50193.1 NAD(P)-dependent dehydrogenase, short-chain alcohol dehydrogenase family [Noviherbaspirillum suwonense]